MGLWCCWDNHGYSIGTPVLNNCLNITLDGNLDAAYGLTTPAITVNNISASTSEYLNIGDNAVITGYLSVGGDVNLARTLYVRTPQQGGGNIRIVPTVDGNEASIGFYKYNDLRDTAPGDQWVCGLNYWASAGYSIGTTVVGVCLNINSEGNVNIPNDIKTHEIMVNRIKSLSADVLTIDDYVTITGNNTIEGSCSILNYLSVGATSIFS